MKTTSSKITVTAAAIIAIAGLSFGGPLNPPPGPVTSTMKTLTEVEPRIAINASNTPGDADSFFRISQPGSYYLTGNITGLAGKNGIEVAADNVTIDLNGFTLRGADGAINGITNANALSGLSIRNGSISHWPSAGIRVSGATSASDVRLDSLTIVSCGGVGISSGPRTTVDSCAISEAPNGLIASNAAILRNSTFANIDVQGVAVGAGSLVDGCTFTTSGDGVSISLNGGATVRNCSITGGGIGISDDPGSLIEGNSIQGTAFSALWVRSRSRVMRNIVSDVQGLGIRVEGTHAVIAENTISRVRGATNDDVGISLLSAASRTSVHHNTIADCEIGLRVEVAGNAIYANELTSNTTHVNIAPGNRVGPVVAGAVSGAVVGGSGGIGMGSTDPYANVLY